jgi:phosphoenolpyruvate phosphomutase
MTLISKTIKIEIEHEQWLASHPEINFSEWVRQKIEEAIAQERGAKKRHTIKAIIVAAGHDKRMGILNANAPKSMLDIKGKTILERTIDTLKQCGIQEIIIVKGYKHEMITFSKVKYYINTEFETTGILHSLFYAEKEMDSDFIFLYSDIIFNKKLLDRLLESKGDISLVIDLDWKKRYHERLKQPEGEAELAEVKNGKIRKIGKQIDQQKAHGEFIGLAYFSKKGAEILKSVYQQSREKYKNTFHESASYKKAYFTDIIQEIIDEGYMVTNLDTYGDWMEIDTFEDYRRAWSEVI